MTTGLTLGEITAQVRAINIEKGWRPAGGGTGENTWGDYVALLNSEVSEALEAYRDHRLTDATAEVRACYLVGEMCAVHDRHHDYCGKPVKPEGVGSELADVLIRLVDMADVWDVDLNVHPLWTLDTVPDFHDLEYRDLLSFGDWMAWLHYRIAAMDVTRDDAHYVLRALATATRHFGIDLEAEYRRKIAYNMTRPYQHGGRTLAGDKETKDA